RRRLRGTCEGPRRGRDDGQSLRARRQRGRRSSATGTGWASDGRSVDSLPPQRALLVLPALVVTGSFPVIGTVAATQGGEEGSRDPLSGPPPPVLWWGRLPCPPGPGGPPGWERRARGPLSRPPPAGVWSGPGKGGRAS